MNYEPVAEPEYWKNRLLQANERHHAIYLCGKGTWEKIEALHRSILANHIGDSESVLDAGCGYGRLLNLMPRHWNAPYLGVDLSPDFIHLAKKEHPNRKFIVGDLRDPLPIKQQYDWVVLISIRPMIIRNLGGDEWHKALVNLKKAARKLMFLEYDINKPLESIEDGDL